MPDNVLVTNPAPNSDYTVASDEVQVGGTNPVGEVQFVKLVDGTLNGTAPIPGSTNGLKVDLSATAVNATAIRVDGSAVTQPISGSVSALMRGTDGITAALTATINVEDGRNALATSDVLTRRLLEQMLIILSDMNKNLMILTATTGNTPDFTVMFDPDER